jgi:hypothetical protein
LPALFCSAALLLSCERSLGTNPIGAPADDDGVDVTDITGIPTDSITSQMRISVDPSNLVASDDDRAVVTVRVYSLSHNPVVGKEVRFSATHGIIDSLDTTDALGIATAIYQSIPQNTEASVMAEITIGDTVMRVARTVTLSGVEVRLFPQTTNTLRNTSVAVKVHVVDGAGQDVP